MNKNSFVPTRLDSCDLEETVWSTAVNSVNQSYQIKNPLLSNKGKPKRRFAVDDFKVLADDQFLLNSIRNQINSASPTQSKREHLKEKIFAEDLDKEESEEEDQVVDVVFKQVSAVKPMKMGKQTSSRVILTQIFANRFTVQQE